MITVTSSAFETDTRTPRKYTGEGKDISPPLTWEGVPEESAELALIVDDPDAPQDLPFVHWLAYGLPADRQGLEEDSNGGAKEGENDFGNQSYGGPMPPEGHGVHHYHFKLYALSEPVDLKPGASRDDLLDAMDGKIIAHGQLTGTYERS